MRHRMRGRKLGRNSSHRKALLRNLSCSLIRSVRIDEDEPGHPKVAGRIVTTLAKAKETRPFVEKLVTMARKSLAYRDEAAKYATSAERNTSEWKAWRESDKWQKWAQAQAPLVALRRRAFAALRDKLAIDILFNELAERYSQRPGGYTRVVRLSTVRLGDAGRQAIFEFVGERDRIKRAKRRAPVVTDEEGTSNTAKSESSSAAAE